MLHDHGIETATGSVKRAETCKPDYEEMIERANSRVDKSRKFLNAALEYFEGRTARDKMAELIGELTTETRKYETEIARLIKEQEQDIR